MEIKIDVRENELIQKVSECIKNIPSFSKIIVKIEQLPIGDIIICKDTKELIIIERKTVADLQASIRDGRYDEQSYRLNGLEHHNHNIIYLVEGDINKFSKNSFVLKTDKLTLYSALFSLNYYKGFSVMRTFSIDETAIYICNIISKIEKENIKSTPKIPFYSFSHSSLGEKKEETNNEDNENNEDNQHNQHNESINEDGKGYINVIKKVKKDNITCDNIGEIMLCSIPGISAVTACAILTKYKSISNLIKEIEKDTNCLKDITYTTGKNQIRKINKSSIANIIKYLNL